MTARILIVDDLEPNIRLLEAKLTAEYFDVLSAQNGRDALTLAREQRPDVILLDVMMPHMTAIEALEIVRKSSDLVTLPIILISALTDTQTIVKGISLGANDYITKPINTLIVMARVKTQIQLKQMADERKSMMRELEQANEIKLQMMQIASHDLKTPLSNLALLIRVIRKLNAGDEKIMTYIGTINKMIASMVRIIDAFLSSTIFLAPDIQAVSALAVLNDVLEQYELSAENKNIKIEMAISEDVLIAADDTRIKQVISNLLSNAIKYTPPDGWIKIDGTIKESLWRLQIRDSGPGIPEDEQQYLFEAFSKNFISTQPTADENSTGVGLWIANKMIESQGGHIGMDSPDEGGCCFWIEIPLYQDERADDLFVCHIDLVV